MDTSIQLSADTHYAIPAVSPEKERLLKQYAFKKSAYGWDNAVPDSVDLTQVHRVLDIAAGSCAWTLDFAATPSIQSRFSKKDRQTNDANKGMPSIQIYVSDIDTKFFPEKDVLDEVGIESFQQDVTKPFRSDLYGTFDLVHICMVTLCLTQTGWSEALVNCYQLLRPGGMFMVDEIDPILYTLSMPPPSPDSAGPDLDTCMGGDAWVHKANRIYTGWALHKGFIVGLTFKLPKMLTDAGFSIVEMQRVVGMYGKLYETSSTHIAAGGETGALEGKKGIKVTDEVERKLTLKEIGDGFNTDGATSVGKFFLAMKPMEE